MFLSRDSPQQLNTWKACNFSFRDRFHLDVHLNNSQRDERRRNARASNPLRRESLRRVNAEFPQLLITSAGILRLGIADATVNIRCI